MDELHLDGRLAQCAGSGRALQTIDVMVPADAEIVLEGYLDERGLIEPEGPYGGFLGYYGAVKRNPCSSHRDHAAGRCAVSDRDHRWTFPGANRHRAAGRGKNRGVRLGRAGKRGS